MSDTPSKRPPPPSLADERDGMALRQAWDALGVPDTDAAWGDLQARISRLAEPAPRVAARSPRRLSVPMARAAAVVGLLLAGAAGAWSVPVQVEAPAGSTRTVALPDGSVAQLNAGSVLRHARGFAWLPGLARERRRVVLEGEAWFEVVSDGRAFEVAAGEAVVRVLGTAFSVRSRAGDAEALQVVVDEGRVAVSAPGSATVELGAGDAARWTPGGELEAGQASLRHALAWRSGGFAARDAPLGDVLEEAERRFGVSVDVAPEVGTDERVTVYYGSGVGLERILSDLVTARGLHFRPTATGWQVVP